jgi:adenosylhomocysteine nucleosidase
MICVIALSAWMKLLFIATDKMEFPGLLRRSTGVRAPDLGAHWSRTASLSGHEILLIANGAGAARAAAAVDATLASFRPDCLISTGFCGGLDPALAIADIVVATTIFASGRVFQVQSPVSPAPHHPGPICTLDHVAATAGEKARLRTTGAIAVEMEAAAVAQRAHALGLPFFCIKTVTDLAGETMANDFNAALRSDGRFDTIRVLAYSLRHPWARLPELFRLRRRCVLAARSLGDFIADCQF